MKVKRSDASQVKQPKLERPVLAREESDMGTGKRPRLSVFRSNKAIYAQIIDDSQGKTLVAASSFQLPPASPSVRRGRAASNLKLLKTEQARKVGELLAKRASKAKIKQVVFDRRRYKYHGRVKALAEGARKGGLDF